MKCIGFTGTQQGMTTQQKSTVRALLSMLEWDDRAIHGDCVGADADFHELACEKGLRVTLHPCTIESKRAHCKPGHIMPAKPPLDRNHDIVDICHVLIACPRGAEEELRSGTWATIRYARKVGRRILIVLPGGKIKVEKGKHS